MLRITHSTGQNSSDCRIWRNDIDIIIIIIIIIHEFHRDATLEQNFRAAMCHVLHYSCNVNAAVANSCGRWLLQSQISIGL